MILSSETKSSIEIYRRPGPETREVTECNWITDWMFRRRKQWAFLHSIRNDSRKRDSAEQRVGTITFGIIGFL